jgi:hypothetical protein
MKTAFADTFYFLALLDSREQFHAPAAAASRDPQLRFVTTEWILTEFGNAYCIRRIALTSWHCTVRCSTTPVSKSFPPTLASSSVEWISSHNDRIRNGL